MLSHHRCSEARDRGGIGRSASDVSPLRCLPQPAVARVRSASPLVAARGSSTSCAWARRTAPAGAAARMGGLCKSRPLLLAHAHKLIVAERACQR